MNDSIKEKLDMFIADHNVVKKCFPWHNTIIKRLAALLYASENKNVNPDKLKKAYEMIKRDTGAFSMFRGNNAVAVSALLAMSENMDYKLSDTLKFYNTLKKAGFYPSDYLVFAACQAIKLSGPSDYVEISARAKTFYDAMKKEHFFLTGQEDYIYAVMLGLSDIPVQSAITRMERLYTLLKQDFRSRGGVQSLTQVLVLGGDEAAAASRAVRLKDKLRENKLRCDNARLVPILGVLSILPEDDNILVRDIVSACEYLRIQKGFGLWSVSKQELLLYSASLYAIVYLGSKSSAVMSSAATAGIINILLAQQAAVIAAASSASATAAAASN